MAVFNDRYTAAVVEAEAALASYPIVLAGSAFHGSGIDAGQREKIFERFHRAEAQHNGVIPGVGLGLYLSRVILRAHDGELACVAPAVGPGAEFVFALPLLALPLLEGSREGKRS